MDNKLSDTLHAYIFHLHDITWACIDAGAETLEIPEALHQLSGEPNDEGLAALEHSIASWTSAISAALETNLEGSTEIQSTLLSTWKDCSATLSSRDIPHYKSSGMRQDPSK